MAAKVQTKLEKLTARAGIFCAESYFRGFQLDKPYKQAYGYFPGVYSIDGVIAYMENRDGNTPVKFQQAETHICKNFFTAMMRRLAGTFRGITPNGRLKRFIFHFVTVPGKWIRTARTWVIKLYTDRPYDKLVYT